MVHGTWSTIHVHVPNIEIEFRTNEPGKDSPTFDIVLCMLRTNRFLRHERIVAAVHRVLRWQGFVSEANPRDMPCPHKSRGGPDFLIWAAVTAIGDVCVSKHTKASFKRKMNQYEELAGMLPNSIVVPLVFGINATPLKESVIELQKVCGKRVTREICLICQMEFARGVTNGMSRLRVRAKTQSQGGACEWSSDSDSVE